MAMSNLPSDLTEGELVYVVWKDSGFSLLADRWQDIDEVKSLKDDIGNMETVGILVDEDDASITGLDVLICQLNHSVCLAASLKNVSS